MTTKKRHVSFYIDNDLVDLLNREPNKSRAINNALRVRLKHSRKIKIDCPNWSNVSNVLSKALMQKALS